VDDSPALPWLIGQLLSPTPEPRLVRLAPALSRRVTLNQAVQVGGPLLGRLLPRLYGGRPGYGLAQVHAAGALLRREGAAKVLRKARQVGSLAAFGLVEEAWGKLGPAWAEPLAAQAPRPRPDRTPMVGRVLAWGPWPGPALEFFDQVLLPSRIEQEQPGLLPEPAVGRGQGRPPEGPALRAQGREPVGLLRRPP
jgi:hypothetical protein